MLKGRYNNEIKCPVRDKILVEEVEGITPQPPSRRDGI